MAKIEVKAKIDGGIHLKYGEIKAGQKYLIDSEDFGEQLFERPKGFESPHEKAAREKQEVENPTDVADPPAVDESPKEAVPPSSEAEKQEGGK